MMTLHDIQEIEESYATCGRESLKEKEHEESSKEEDEDYVFGFEEKLIMEGQQLIVRRTLHSKPTPYGDQPKRQDLHYKMLTEAKALWLDQ